MTDEITLKEFLEDIRKQKERAREKRIERKTTKEAASKEAWETHPDALSLDEYNSLTRNGERRLGRPRLVWLPGRKRWTVGPPVSPLEWGILVQSEPVSRRRPSRISVEGTIRRICSQFDMNKYRFSECVSRLYDRRLLKIKGGFRRSKIADKWLFPDLTGPRAGGKWHREHIYDYVDITNRLYGCHTYVDRGFCPSVKMPDVVTVRPRAEDHTVRFDLRNPIYAEFKSAVDMREHLTRLKEQLQEYKNIPLYLRVGARISKVKDMLEKLGKREVSLLDLLKKAEDNTVHLCGSEGPKDERLFLSVIEKIKEGFAATYDRKARLVKTGTDPQGRERHSLFLYDSLGAEKNIGQVIPDFADDVEDFAGLYFSERYLGRVITSDYIYTPSRKPTPENKTWKWERRKTKGSRFRSFPA